MTQPTPQPGQYPPAAPAPAAGEARPSIGALFASVTGQISSIIRDEVELNKAKLRAFASKSGKGIGLLVAAAVFILLLIVLILALVGVSSLKSAQAHRPDPAASVAATKEAIEKGLGK